MKNSIKALFLAVLLIAAAPVYSKDDKVNVPFTVEELAFSINILNSIELKGEEVPPYIDIRNLLMDVYKDVSSGKRKNASTEFSMAMARNFLFFIQRARLKGSEAVMFNDVNSKVVEAIKKSS